MKTYLSNYGKKKDSKMAKKHNKIIKFIESIPIGNELSVRNIAKELDVSEGTAYRAIKDAEKRGLVTTIERVGTIRIESFSSNHYDQLTFEHILTVIDGELLGGHAGLGKVLNRFYIGAMTKEAMLKYLSDESLMIIGNREEAQKLSLKHGAAVLITGGFSTTQEIIDLSNELELPVMTTTYDTFTVSSIINRAMTDQLIKKEIMLVDNVYTQVDYTDYLKVSNTVYDYRLLSKSSGHSRFPVINHRNQVVGIISARDVVGKSDKILISRVMTRNPITVNSNTSVANVAHTMIWDDYEVMPVVAEDMSLKGIVSRRDIMKAMQSQHRQERFKDTIPDQVDQMILDGVNDSFLFEVSPQMVNDLGNISFGVLSEVIAESTIMLLNKKTKGQVLFEQMQLHYFKLIQLGSRITIRPKIFDESRKSVRVDIEITAESGLVAKALLTCQYIE